MLGQAHYFQCRFAALIRSAARSPIIMLGALILPLVMVGITDASAMRKRSTLPRGL